MRSLQRPSLFWRGIIGGSLALSFSGASFGSHLEPEAQLRALVAKLNDQSLEQRENASVQLQSDGSVTLALIEGYLLTSPPGLLAAEQRQRLENAAYGRFITSPRAAMGVQFSQLEGLNAGVQISLPLDGFDSSRVLQAGDIIHRIDGTVVMDQSSMRAVIVSHSPGDKVGLQIEREGERLDVTLVMGNYEHLHQLNPQLAPGLNRNITSRADLDTQTLGDAWQIRRQRLTRNASLPADKVIEPGLSSGQWTLVSGKAQRANNRARSQRTARVFDAGAQRLLINNGVFVRAGTDEMLPKTPALCVLTPGGSGRDGFVEEPPVFAAGLKAFELKTRALELTTEISRVRLEIDRHQSSLMRNGLDNFSRDTIRKNINVLQLRLSEAESKLEQVTVMMNNP